MQFLPGDLAQLQADDEANRRRQAQAQALQQAGFNPVQGGNPLLSLLTSFASTFAGNKLMKDSDTKASELLAKQFEMENQQSQAKMEAEQRRRDEDYQRDLEKLREGEKYKAEFRAPDKASFEEKLFNSLPENLRGQAALGKFGLGPKAGPGPSESDRKIAQLRELGATDDQIRSMLLGGAGGGQSAPSGYRATPDGGLEAIPGGPADKPEETDPKAGLAHDALRWVAATTGKSMKELKAMSPSEVATLVSDGGPALSGPLLGNLPGAGMTTEGIRKQMAARLARLNNPKGTVTGPDFDAAEASLPDVGRLGSVNAELIQNMLEQAGVGGQAPQPQQPQAPAPGTIQGGYRFKGGDPANPQSWEPVN